MTDHYKGSCLCGNIQYEINGPLSDVVNCHCSQCRKQTGLYVAATIAQRSDVTLNNENNINWYQASPEAKRGFCANCGSMMFWKPEPEPEKPYLAILAGSLDGPTGLKTRAHIYCADKGDFYEISDDLPQYPQSD